MYFVYELVDPRTNIPAYVGITDNPNLRLRQHLAETYRNPEKDTWIQSLLKEHVEPKMRILEIVGDVEQARARETHWIQYYNGQGLRLTNIYHNTTEDKQARKGQKPKRAPVSVNPGGVWYMRKGGKPRGVRSILEYKQQKNMSTEQEVADQLGVSIDYLRQLMERHQIHPAILPGWDVMRPNILYKGIDEPLYREDQVSQLKNIYNSII